MLQINDLSFGFGECQLFNKATLFLPGGGCYGLVGRNGSGKSTLLSLLVGDLAPDSGVIEIQKNASVSLVAQEAPGGDEPLIDTVLAADKERTGLLADAERASDPQAIADIQERLAMIDAHSAPARAAAILAGLGFDERAQQQPCSSLSGGWRMRVGLAQALFAAPDLLLLDEPTNYLDLEGALWLDFFLRDYNGTILLVSHDRELLNGPVDEIMHLRGGRLKRYAGGYDAFERKRNEELAHQHKLRSKQEAERRHIMSFVERFRAKASKARQAQSRLKALEKMQPISSVVEERTPVFRFPEINRLSPPIIILDDASTGYSPGKPVLQNLSFTMDDDERIAILGPNGNGKSTFAKFLAEELPAFGGRVRRAKKMTVGFFTQHQLDALNHDRSAYDHMRPKRPEDTEAQVRARLGAFGFEGQQADVKVASLSGGERARLVFALISADAPELLILDEPTNHLDVDSREALIHALNDYDGALILISHDQHLIETCCDRLYVVTDSTVKPYDGTIGDYRDEILTRRGKPGVKRADGTREHSNAQKLRRKEAARRRALLSPLRKTARELEIRIGSLQDTLDKIDAALADPALYSNEPPEQLANLSQKRKALSEAIEEAEQRWLETQSAIEEASD